MPMQHFPPAEIFDMCFFVEVETFFCHIYFLGLHDNFMPLYGHCDCSISLWHFPAFVLMDLHNFMCLQGRPP